VKKSLLAAGSILAALMLALTACSSGTTPPPTTPTDTGAPATSDTSTPPPAPTHTYAQHPDFLACMVSDSGGFDDKSFNQTSYLGLQNAVKDMGVQEKHLQSQTAADYANNVNAMVAANCNIIIGVGFNLSDSIVTAAKANPNIYFAVVDDSPTAPSNFKAIVFNTNESSFLAGYLAASITQTGIVGTYAGMKIPSVTIFMDGYVQGVAYYNQQKGTSVKVLGWDFDKQDGTAVQSENPFGDIPAGMTAAQNQVSQGADVLFPVAGNAGTGALQVAANSGGKVSAIWVDTDGCISAEQYCSVMPTSVYKAMDVAVEQVIEDAANGTFSSTPYVGTLANNGTGIAPWHLWDSKISDQTKQEIATIKQQIIDGTITVQSAGSH